ncbi:MAG TPA: D-arabinono-1,4-lactone oxidase [Lacipirellulaceae bacterium]|nr:D-arabinono-1,4-lactone oxidase [Lacipirellulaceae bacterium]
MKSNTYSNFGGNQWFQPNVVYTPRDEAELLEVMGTCRGRRIRAIGRFHSWSEAPVANDVLIDLRHFRDVSLQQRDGCTWVSAGGGCQIKLLQSVLGQAGCTLPSLGLINEQTIAGAISTATHGSGRESMSHFIDEVRVAIYDPANDAPVIRTIDSGDELRAARCSLGCLGVIVSVGFWVRPAYRIEEHFRSYDHLDGVLAQEEEYPLQQFFLMPWWWKYLSQHRRETTAPVGGGVALYRLYVFFQFDIGLHLLVRLVARLLRSPRLTRFVFRYVTPRMAIKNWRVVDDSNKMLVMEHEFFQHIECEMFVVRSRLQKSLDLVVCLLKHFEGDQGALDSQTRDTLRQLNLLEEVDDNCGTYTHHYPICVRRVLPDDTLISMSSGNTEPCYALSFISYERRGDRAGFMAFARVVSRLLGERFGARPHWGKVCPLTPTEVARLYPSMPRFREICNGFDSRGMFRNEWVDRTLFGNG